MSVRNGRLLTIVTLCAPIQPTALLRMMYRSIPLLLLAVKGRKMTLFRRTTYSSRNTRRVALPVADTGTAIATTGADRWLGESRQAVRWTKDEGTRYCTVFICVFSLCQLSSPVNALVPPKSQNERLVKGAFAA